VIEVRNESGVDSSVSEMALHHTQLALSATFPSVKFNLLALYCLEFTLVRPIPVDISDDAGVFEVYNGVVDKESGGRGRVEDVEVVVFDPRTVEIGSRMCMCIKGDGIFRVAALASPYKVSVDPNLSEGDITCHLILTILIEEDKRVLPRITAVVLAPSGSWMIRVIKLLSELRDIGNGTRCGGEGDGRVVLSKLDWFVVLHVIVRHVILNLLEDLGDEEEVFDHGVIAEGGGEYLVVKLSVSPECSRLGGDPLSRPKAPQ